MYQVGEHVVHMQGGPNHEDEAGIVRISGRLNTTVELADGTMLTVPPRYLRRDDTHTKED